ncbi:MAG: toxin-antitoxin system HicB family antitoxin [Candidatus Eisenbacteria bacterium]
MSQRKAFLLRLPPELHAALEKWAADELRSLNGQLEYLLQQAVQKAGRSRARRPEIEGDEADSESS